MNTLKKFVCIVAASAGVFSSAAWSHAMLETSMPAKGAVLAASPAAITLHFNENVEGDFTTIKVLDAGGRNVVTKKAALDKADRKTVQVPLSTLKAGEYKVQWSTVGPDGHRRTGNYGFTVK